MVYHVRFTDGSTQDFEDWTPDTTITQVKEAIKTFKLVSHIDLIRLIFGGRILKNPDTLQKSGIESGSTFHCVIRAEPLENPIASLVATGNEEEGDVGEVAGGVAGGLAGGLAGGVAGGVAGGLTGGVAEEHGNLEELLQTLGLQNITMDISGGGLEGFGLGGLGEGLGGGGLGGGIGLQFLQQFLQTLRDSSNNIIQHLNDTSGNQITTMTIPLTGGRLNTGNISTGDDNDESILGGEHVTPENIQTLVGMGFNDNVDMRIALRLSNGNIQHAVEYLLNL